ncbi:MAG: hypothetical protein JWO53_357, partial [Chlamydiia bacterium]|nr:hypothetical protein [Chlamydiia bacterium]
MSPLSVSEKQEVSKDSTLQNMSTDSKGTWNGRQVVSSSSEDSKVSPIAASSLVASTQTCDSQKEERKEASQMVPVKHHSITVNKEYEVRVSKLLQDVTWDFQKLSPSFQKELESVRSTLTKLNFDEQITGIQLQGLLTYFSRIRKLFFASLRIPEDFFSTIVHGEQI